MNGRRSPSLVAAVALAAAAAVAGAVAAGGIVAHAALDEGGAPIPAWVKTVFGYYADGDIGDAELIAALEYLIDHGIIQVGASAPPAGADGAESDGAEHAAWALDEAEFNDALAERLRDDMHALRIEIRAGGYMPGQPADYDQVIMAGQAEIRAVEAYAAALRAAAADGDIAVDERTAIERAGRAADAASQAAADAVAASPLGAYMALSQGLMSAFAGALTDGPDGGTGADGMAAEPDEPATCPTPAELLARAAPAVRDADAAADDASYIDDLAQQRRKHLRDFEAGLSGAYTFRANGDFGTAGNSAASAAGGDVAAYDDMLGAIKDAIRADERLADAMERAARDGVISAAESAEIAEAEAEAEAASCKAAAEYDVTPYGRSQYSGGTFSAYMRGFR